MRLRGIISTKGGSKKGFGKDVGDLKGFLNFILSADRVVLDENGPVEVTQDDQSFVIYSVQEEDGEVLFDAGTNVVTDGFRRFIRNVEYIANHPEMLG